MIYLAFASVFVAGVFTPIVLLFGMVWLLSSQPPASDCGDPHCWRACGFPKRQCPLAK